MIDGYEHEGHVVCPGHFDVALCFRQLGNAIRQEITKFVAGNNQNGQVDHALQEFFPEVNQVYRNDVATARNLNLHADGDVAWPSIDRLLFNPIDSATLLLRPSASSLELRVDQNAKDLGAIRVLAFLNKKLKSSNELPDFPNSSSRPSL